jgi:hypothetical protein
MRGLDLHGFPPHGPEPCRGGVRYFQAVFLRFLEPNRRTHRTYPSAGEGMVVRDGGPRVAAIGLTDIGKRIVAPTEEGDDLVAMREAFLPPRVIREFLEKYEGSKLPSRQIGLNVLENLGVAGDSTGRTLDLMYAGRGTARAAPRHRRLQIRPTKRHQGRSPQRSSTRGAR